MNYFKNKRLNVDLEVLIQAKETDKSEQEVGL